MISDFYILFFYFVMQINSIKYISINETSE